MAITNALFTAINETQRNFASQYSKEELAIHLYDIDDEHFAMTTLCREMDETITFVLNLPIYQYIRVRIYSKQTLRVIETYVIDEQSNCPSKLKKILRYPEIREVGSINLINQRIYIAGKNLVMKEY